MSEESEEPSEAELSFKRDLVRSLERTVDHQVDGIRESVGRHTNYIRVNLIFLGLMATALSLFFNTRGPIDSLAERIPLLVFGVGILSMILSIGYSIKAHLGTSVNYSSITYVEDESPISNYNRQINNFNRIIDENQKLINSKIKTDRVSLSTQLAGMTFSIAGILYLLFRLPIEIQFVTTVVLGIIIGYFINKILSGDFDPFSSKQG